MNALGLEDNQDTYSRLIKAYGEKHRAYHTFEHIDACLRHLDKVQDKADRPHEIELALWFHDAIYKPFSVSNEEDSAKWAQIFLQKNAQPKEAVGRIHNLVMVTKDHVATSSNDEQLMLDIDLTILGADKNIYDQFEKDVRKEYKRVPKFIFRKKRKKILIDFLSKEKIFNHQYFFDKYETKARDNLARAIAVL